MTIAKKSEPFPFPRSRPGPERQNSYPWDRLPAPSRPVCRPMCVLGQRDQMEGRKVKPPEASDRVAPYIVGRCPDYGDAQLYTSIPVTRSPTEAEGYAIATIVGRWAHARVAARALLDRDFQRGRWISRRPACHLDRCGAPPRPRADASFVRIKYGPLMAADRELFPYFPPPQHRGKRSRFGALPPPCGTSQDTGGDHRFMFLIGSGRTLLSIRSLPKHC